jgi:hypothetical protein
MYSPDLKNIQGWAKFFILSQSYYAKSHLIDEKVQPLLIPIKLILGFGYDLKRFKLQITSVADPRIQDQGSGAFLTPGSGIRDG